MKVLIADKFPDHGVAELEGLGLDVTSEPDLKEDALEERIVSSGADVLIVRSTKVSASMLEKGQLSLVVRAGAGYNTIDVTAASDLGIYVANCPGKNSVAVAELAFGLILALDRRIPDGVQDLRQGVWNKKEYGKAQGIKGRTLGLVGLGNIGREMIPRARAFGMNVVAWSRSLTEDDAARLGVEARPGPREVAAACDVLSIHVALNDETRGLVGAEVIGALPDGAFVINTSRAEVLDQAALAAAVRDRGVRAGLDVFENEPASATGTFEDSIVGEGVVYGSHHIGASTEQSQAEIAAEAVRIVRAFHETGSVPNVVNLSRRSPASHLLVVRHRDKVGVLAHVFRQLKEAGINAQEAQNLIFEGAKAAVARIGVDRGIEDDLLRRIREGNEDILDLKVLPV